MNQLHKHADSVMFLILRTNILLRELRNLSRGTVNAEIRERCSRGKKKKKPKIYNLIFMRGGEIYKNCFIIIQSLTSKFYKISTPTQTISTVSEYISVLKFPNIFKSINISI